MDQEEQIPEINLFNKKHVDEDFFKIKPAYPLKYANLSNGEKIGYLDSGKGEDVCLLVHGHYNCSLNMVPHMKILS